MNLLLDFGYFHEFDTTGVVFVPILTNLTPGESELNSVFFPVDFRLW